MYEDILQLLETYENANMKNIKQNLKEQFNYKKLSKGSFAILGIGKHQEQSYLNQAHPHNIPFLTLIKICNYMKISLEELVKENNYIPDPNKAKNTVKWTKKRKLEFLNDIKLIGVENTAEKYKLSLETIVKHKKNFEEGLKDE